MSGHPSCRVSNSLPAPATPATAFEAALDLSAWLVAFRRAKACSAYVLPVRAVAETFCDRP